MNQPIEKLSAACDGYDKQSDRVLMWNKINEIIDYLFPDKKVELAARDEGYECGLEQGYECGLDQAKSIKLAAYKRGLGKAKYFVEELEVGKDNICLKCCLDIEKKIDQEIKKNEK